MDAGAVRHILRRATTATLATFDVGTGHPFASLVEVATTSDARPILLLSDLARHTRNLKADARASLLVDQRQAAGNALAAERTTLVGMAHPSADVDARRRYLARYPAAGQYAGFGDFGIWVLDVALAHTIAGFGRIREVAGSQIILASAATTVQSAAEAELITRVNSRLHDRRIGENMPTPTLCVVGIDEEGVDVIGSDGLARHSFDVLQRGQENIVETIVCSLSRMPGGMSG